MSVRAEAGALPSVALPQAMQRTAATTFKKSHDGQTTPRFLVNSAGMGEGIVKQPKSFRNNGEDFLRIPSPRWGRRPKEC